ncbi:uncharacterized protein LOC134184147 [Corticium candelabrum]|uniref:uncharacterized protein LOC134184147 n=1 Tax=Corticium candelabrum TaxID=121492 RepID=UPI002E2EDD1E|nr:uncharacterized protein LOC134184147 [Corticium candelabrum]
MTIVLLQLLVLLVVFSCTSGDSPRPKVLILGGGLAGLRVGQVLQQNGVRDFLILEADNKLGGRFLSFCLPEVSACVSDIHVEPSLPSPHPIGELFDKCKIAYAPEAVSTIKAVDDAGNDVSAEINLLSQRLDSIYYNLVQAWRPEEDDMNLRGAYSLYGWHPRTPVELALDKYYTDAFLAAKPSELSMRMYQNVMNAVFSLDGSIHLYVVRNSFNGNQDLVDCLTKSFLNQSDERVKLNTRVTQIQYSESGVVVTTSDGKKYEADFAVVTFSLGVLQQETVKFIPSPNYAKRKAINKFRMGYYTFVYSRFPYKIDGSIARSNQEPLHYISVSSHRQVSRLIYEVFETIEEKVNHSQPYNLFLSWIAGDDALRVETQEINKTTAEFKDMFGRFFGKSIPEPKVFVSQGNTNPLYYGAIPSFPSGATYEDYDKLRESLGRVFFAGDAYYMTASLNGATRALYSGNETAMAVIECMNGGSCAMSKFAVTPPEQQCPTSGTGSGRGVVANVVAIVFFLAMSILVY